MSVTIPDTRLQLWAEEIRRITRVHRSEAQRATGLPVEVSAIELGCVLDELIRRRGLLNDPERLFGENTKKLIAMKVGDKIILRPPPTQSALTTSRNTARKHLKVEARWSGFLFDNGKAMEVERLPDGAKYYHGKKNPVVEQMAKMNINGRITVDLPSKCLTSALKIRARKEMNHQGANWKSERLANGKFRLRRIS